MSETANLPTHYIGICDECRVAKTFTSERAREIWERNHPYYED